MRAIYGLKMFTLEDITSKIGGRPAVCNLLKSDPSILNRFEDDEKMVIDTGLGQNFTIYNMQKCLRFVFVSIELLEERLIMEKFTSNTEEVLKMLTTISRAEKFERIVHKHMDSYEKFSNQNSGDALLNKPCFMFVYDKDDKSLIDVFTAIPGEIIRFLLQPIEYKCSVCGEAKQTDNTSFDHFIPEMYYRVIDKEIDYRCEHHKTAGYLHIGE